MIGLDTNVLVRYLAQDDAAQSARATRLIEHELNERDLGFIGLVVLVETCWVLKRLYGATPTELRETVRDLLDTRQFVVEQRTVVLRAVTQLGSAAGDLADALIAESAAEAGCARTVTFDKQGVRLGMELLK
jgi:predicted nucleic-acid-binding protein